MHRSGTSAITRGLSALGVPLGNNLMPPVLNNNNKGFFEDLEINEVNTELLAALNRDWHSLSRIPPESLQSETLEPLKLRAIELMRTKIGDHKRLDSQYLRRGSAAIDTDEGQRDDALVTWISSIANRKRPPGNSEVMNQCDESQSDDEAAPLLVALDAIFASLAL